ncbi:MAG: sugar ABC transporter ATP-binding protein [Phycisphaerae bacterium]|nr:sugar ABC transporter ATP-binding protein [Phycisphaerae bacterium]
MLAARGLRKRFGPVLALDSVDLEIRPGEVLGLMGENGAGKSTLIKCLTGLHRPDAGTIERDGRPITLRSPRDAEALGVSTVHQEVHLIPHATVAENICLGREPRRNWLLGGSIRWRRVRERANAALARLGLALDVRREVSTLPLAIRQLVAIARALDIEARTLILDEPTSSLDRDEVERLFSTLRRLRGEGLGIVVVTHFLDQVYAIADRIAVLRDGRLVGAALAASLPRAELVAMMVGRAIAPAAARASSEAERPRAAALSARGLRRRGALDGVDLDVAAGEAVGLAGLLGSGRSETLRALFGADPIDEGAIEVSGRRHSIRSPGAAMRLGLAFLSEDRRGDGILPSLSVRDNLITALQAQRGILRRVGRREAAALADRLIASLRIKAPSASTPIARLSGGNQQKVLLARWLATDPRVLLLDEPTRGIDIGAKADVLALVASLREKGLAVVFVSSELEELAAACGRVVVLRDRRSVAQLRGADVDPSAMLAAVAAAPEGGARD